jgi:G8 domain
MHSYKFTFTRVAQVAIICLPLLLPTACLSATVASTNVGGAWSVSSTWASGVIPSNGDAVTIASGASVTIDSDLTLQSLTISGTLTFETTTARNVTISNNVIIDNTGTFQTGSASSITTHALSVGGDLTNNGILDFSTNGNTAGAGITFTGASDNTFGGNGTKTNLLTLIINKNSKMHTLLLTPSVLTIQGSSSNAQPFLTLTKGTIHIAGTYSFSSTVTVRAANAYTVCGSNTGFWLDNPNFVVLVTAGSVDADGLFKLSQGIFSVGSGSTNSFNLTTTTDLIIEGGTINVASRLKGSPLNFTMTGGIVNVCTQGNGTATASFYVNAKNFTMSGGTVILNKPSTNYDDYFADGTITKNITGGTLTCLANATGLFNITGNIPNITVSGSATFAVNATSVVCKNITINNNAILHLDSFKLKVQGNIQNNGTIKSRLHANWEKGCIDFIGNSTQTYSGTGVFGTLAEPINSFSMNNTAGVTFDISSNVLNINSLYLFKGSISNAGKLIFCNTATFVAKIQYGATDIATVSGNLDATPDFSNLTAGLAVLYCKETNPRTTGFEIPSNRTLNQLTLITNNITLAGGDLNVSSFLQFSSGKINLGNNNLILESNVTITGATNNGYVVTNGTGRLTRKGVGVGIVNPVDFPVGTTTTYDLVSITNTGTTDDFSVNVASTLDAFSPMPNKYLQRQWNISEATVGGSDVTLSLTCAAGVPTNNFDAAASIQIGHYKSNNVWERIPATMSNSVATANNITSFSPFVIINQNAVLPVELVDFKGVANGKQNNISWSTASERDTKCFILERRNNYGDFKSLDLVAATGQSYQPQFYQWVDHAPAPLSMYRLKIMDLNGSYEYSKVISIENAGGNAMTILSNFTSDDLTIRLSDAPMGEGKISIFDMQGKLQYVQNIDIQNNITDVKLSINNLPNGSYLFVCNVVGQILSKKWVKI